MLLDVTDCHAKACNGNTEDIPGCGLLPWGNQEECVIHAGFQALQLSESSY